MVIKYKELVVMIFSNKRQCMDEIASENPPDVTFSIIVHGKVEKNCKIIFTY